MSTWVVPGCPLTDGSGWKIWYAHPGDEAYAPANVQVRQHGQLLETVQTSESLGVPQNFKRSLSVATVRLVNAKPGESFSVFIPELGEQRAWRTFTDQLPESGLSFIFGSCFWRNDDKEGYYARAVDAALRAESPLKPVFKILAGDQLYLDYPVPLNPFSSAASKVSNRYQDYWGDPNYQKVLCSTPNFFLCDDHEWWNDYPERQNHLPHTLTAGQRANYGQVATEYYDRFQRCLNPAPTRWQTFDIKPVSFFFADTRSQRDSVKREDKIPQFMQEDQWQAIEQWQRSLKGPGLLVTGMPLFQDDGDWKDHSLSNFRDDYRRFTRIISDSLLGKNNEGRPHDIVILSGDIHTARHCIARVINYDDPHSHQSLEVHELIASPASRVGPFLSTPSPSMPPGRLPETDNPKWADVETIFTSSDNNLGVIRLHPVPNFPSQVRLEFVSYLVRPYRRPSWRFWSGEPDVDFNDHNRLKLYETELYLK